MRILILLLPWLELLTLIQLGISIGALAALAYVFLTLVGGIMLLRFQGRDMFLRLREAQDGRIFGPQIFVDDMSVGLAALLLMVPGLITDAAAVLVLFGPLRRRLSRWLFGGQVAGGPDAGHGSGPGTGAASSDGHTTIEGEYRRVDRDRR